MAPPSSLPNWYSINEVILESLARRLEAFSGPEFGSAVLRQLIATRDENRYFFPDYQAQIIEDECGPGYFRVLQALDADAWNANHAALAALARAGLAAAIVTTNFDRLIERALGALGVEHRVYRNREEYASIAKSPLPVIKVHGSVEDPGSMVDTLRQRLMGRPEALEQAIGRLLRNHHVLFAGFSGADLAYDEGYLGLRAAASENRGFTCLLYPGSAPNPGMESLKQAWGGSARYLEARLPEWFQGFFAALEIEPPPFPSPDPVDRLPALREHASVWSQSLGHMTASAILAELLESSGRPELAYQALVHTYNGGGDIRDPGAPGYARYNYQLGRRLLERGEFGTPVDPYYGRKAQREGFDPYTANDCFQCLNRALTDEFPEGFLAMGLYEAYRGYPANGAARIRAIRKVAAERGAVIPFLDACRHLAIVYEILSQLTDALEWLEAAHQRARRIGDEPRRARLCAELARFLAYKQRYEEAHERLREGAAIAGRLHLGAAQAELWAAEGCVLKEQGRGPDALSVFGRAITAHENSGRRPALLRTLIDATEASYQAGDQPLLDRVQSQIYDLADDLPGYSPHVALMMLRIARAQGDLEAAQALAADALRLAHLYQNPAVAEMAKQLTP
jgi:tetratricopeptide (TPR) repeat protein